MQNDGPRVQGPTIREIWVKRDNDVVEYKPWLIFDINLSDASKKKIAQFLEQENSRTTDLRATPPSADALIAEAHLYSTLVTTSRNLPPRLFAIGESDLDEMPTELTRTNWCTFGDSVGGISPKKPRTHNDYLSNLSDTNSPGDIVFSPGLLCRIPVTTVDGTISYIFQLAEKNLRTKGQIFYKPIGGHLKYTKKFVEHILRLGLRQKGATMPQDVGDIAFFVPRQNFNVLRALFLEQIATSEPSLIVPPISILSNELAEELGPRPASDGISLLTEFEVKINVTQNN